MADLIDLILTEEVPTTQVQPKTRRRRVATAVKVEEGNVCAATTSQVHRDTLAALVGGGAD